MRPGCVHSPALAARCCVQTDLGGCEVWDPDTRPVARPTLFWTGSGSLAPGRGACLCPDLSTRLAQEARHKPRGWLSFLSPQMPTSPPVLTEVLCIQLSAGPHNQGESGSWFDTLPPCRPPSAICTFDKCDLCVFKSSVKTHPTGPVRGTALPGAPSRGHRSVKGHPVAVGERSLCLQPCCAAPGTPRCSRSTYVQTRGEMLQT